MAQRIISWFSNGAASAVMTKKLLQYNTSGSAEVIPVCCDTRPSEHQDNYRFSADCEKWFGVPIVYIRNDKYATVDDVVEGTRYMSGVNGARCTTELKKIPRHAFAEPDDIHCFGFTADRRDAARADKFINNNPDMRLQFPLVSAGITKADCLLELRAASITIPAMYELGFDNNNCPGCLKASSAWYWDKIRTHFPEVFKTRCEQSRALGVRLVEIKHHVRIFLDELPLGPFKKRRNKEDLSCGPGCGPQGGN